MRHEFNILQHLHSKIDVQQHADHRFTEHQRSVRELLVYLAYVYGKAVTLMDTGDMSIFANMKELQDNFNHNEFSGLLDTQYSTIETIVNSRSEEQLQEKITLFGRITNTRMNLLVEFVLAQVSSYKMQLFLQLKHAGLHDLKSSNLWMGVDTTE